MKKVEWTQKSSQKEREKIHKKFWDNLIPKAYPLTKGDVRLPICLDYFTLSSSQHSQLQKDLTNVVNASKKIVKLFYSEKSLQKYINLREEEKSLIFTEKELDLRGIIRADIFFNSQDNSFKLVEINTDYPDGIFLHDITANQLRKEQGISENQLHTRLFEELLKNCGLTQEKSIGICWDNNRFFKDEYEVSKMLLERRGWKNIITAPIEKLQCKDNKLTIDNIEIDYLRRGTELSKFRENSEVVEALASNSQTIVQNSLKMRLLGHKMLMAVMYNPEFQDIFSKEEKDSIKNLVPETKKVTPQTSEEIIKNKDFWVIKLADGTEGADVIIGSSKSHLEWTQFVHKAQASSAPWIAQQKVFIPQDMFEIYDEKNQKLRKVQGHYDLCPHLILDTHSVNQGHTLVRFSSQEIVNVMQGGGITYAFPE
jgi:hypothetical protein